MLDKTAFRGINRKMKKLFLLIMSILCISNAFGDYQTAKVSWYSNKSNGGSKTASGVKFNENLPHVAHKFLPFGSIVEFHNPKTGKKEQGKIVDRGPYIRGREFDLSKSLAKKLGFFKSGVAHLQYKVVHKPDKVNSTK